MEDLNKLISIIIITFGRKEEVVQCLRSTLGQKYSNFEIIFINNNEDKKISEYLVSNIDSLNNNKIKYFKTIKNLGVPGGRNLGIKKAKGDILVFIDDDAFFEKNNALQKVYKEFCQNSKLGILSFKIINYFSKKIERNEFPHKNKKLDSDNKFETTYFVGAGHAIKKEIFNKVGLYPEDFFYGGEELDLSFRSLDVSCDIFYFPEVVVFHKKSLEGRLDNKKMWQKLLENRIRISIRNLPWKYVFISTFVWTGKVLLEVKGNFCIIFKAFINVLKDKNELKKERLVVSSKTIKKLKKLQGRLYY